MDPTTVTLNQAIDAAMRLPFEQREMLLEILFKRQTEARRERLAAEAQRSLQAFRAGDFAAQTAEEVIRELHRALEEDEE